MTEQGSIGSWIRRAYEGAEACPPPEAYLPQELAALDRAARERLESHAESCVACAAERELAQAFEASVTESPGERRQIDRIVRRLERRPPHGKRGGLFGGALSWTSIGQTPALRWAAALVLLIGVGLGVRNAITPPPLADGGPAESATRSSAVEIVAPLGEIAGRPRELVWQGVEGAAEYRVTVRAVDDEVLWRGATRETALAIADELGVRLLPAVTYFWTVEALDEQGRRMAWSADARFSFGPEREELP